MRTYLIGQDEEHVIELVRTKKHSSELIEFEFKAQSDGEPKDHKKVFVRKLAGNYFASSDRLNWEKIARQKLPQKVVNINKIFDVYRGYKPSGLSAGETGDLYTQMPGKVVNIPIREGQEVTQGDTLLILEAMKMENEVKSGVDGTVKKIHVKEGDALDRGVLLMEVDS